MVRGAAEILAGQPNQCPVLLAPQPKPLRSTRRWTGPLVNPKKTAVLCRTSTWTFRYTTSRRAVAP